jgi:hypothetical protein
MLSPKEKVLPKPGRYRSSVLTSLLSRSVSKKTQLATLGAGHCVPGTDLIGDNSPQMLPSFQIFQILKIGSSISPPITLIN